MKISDFGMLRLPFVMVSALVALLACRAHGGTAVRTFEWYRGAPVADFQVPLVLEEGVDGFTYAGAAAGGADLCVADAGGAPLPIEVESWNPGGRSVVWVKIPAFSKDTVLALAWGGDAGEPLRSNLWDGMNLVMHLADAHDSSAFNGSFTCSQPVPVEGPLEGSAFATTANEKVASGLSAGQIGQIGNAFTFSFWLKSDNRGTPSEYVFVSFYNNSGQFAILHGYKAGCLELFSSNATSDADPRNASSISIPDLGWHHYAWTYDGATLRCYRDGVRQSETGIKFSYKAQTGNLAARIGGTSSKGLSASMDEFRIETVTRSPEWIAAACETQAQFLREWDVDIAFPECAPAEPLPDFTALVAMNAQRVGWDAITAAVNGRLRFRAEKGTRELVCEREMLCGEGTADCAFWVRLPELANGTRIRASRLPPCVPAVTIPYRDTNAWSEAYLHVYHLSPIPSKQFRYDCAHAYSLSASSDYKELPRYWGAAVDGPTGRYAAMQTGTNTASCITIGSEPPRALTNRFTLAFWARKDDFANPKDAYAFCYVWNGGQASLVAGYGSYSRNAFRLFGGSGSYAAGSDVLPIPDADWHHYVFTCDGARLRGYRDGEEIFSSAKVFNFGLANFRGQGASGYFGSSSKPANAFMGAFDEFRVLYEPRSAEWVRACCANQNAYRAGAPRICAPTFAPGGTAACAEERLDFTVRLNGSMTSRLVFCWGASDGGENLADWANRREVGTGLAEGVFTENVADLPPDARVCARFFATNEWGCAWSPALVGRMPIRAGGVSVRIRPENYAGRETLTNFPLCVRLPSTLKLPASPRALRFSGADGEPLPFEASVWNPSGESVAWVRVPRMTAATEIFASWGRFDDATEPWDARAVWGDACLRMYHFDGAGTDSSAYSVSASGAASFSAADAGVVGRAWAFPGTSAGTFAAPSRDILDFANGFTLSMWAKTGSGLSNQYVAACVRSHQTSVIHGFNGDAFELYSSDWCAFEDGAPAEVQAVTVMRVYGRMERPDDGWHHYVWSHDGRAFCCWRDGELVRRTETENTLGGAKPEERTRPINFGGTSSGASLFSGSLDEFRLENVARSHDWVRACWMNEAGTLATIGPAVIPGTIILFR